MPVYSPHIDIFHSSIVINLEDASSQEIKIKNCWEKRYDLLKVKKGDIFNIKGIGKIKVININHYDRSHEYDLDFYERIFFCRKIEEWNNNTETSLVAVTDNRLADLVFAAKKQKQMEALRENFHKTWGYDEPYVE